MKTCSSSSSLSDDPSGAEKKTAAVWIIVGSVLGVLVVVVVVVLVRKYKVVGELQTSLSIVLSVVKCTNCTQTHILCSDVNKLLMYVIKR